MSINMFNLCLLKAEIVLTIAEDSITKKKKFLDEDSAEKLLRSSSALESILENVIDGDICLNVFEYLNERKERLLSLCAVTVNLNSHSQRKMLENAFLQREKQRQSYLQAVSDVKDYLGSCESYVKGKLGLLLNLTNVKDMICYLFYEIYNASPMGFDVLNCHGWDMDPS